MGGIAPGMSDDLLKRKLEKSFGQMDIDGNGYIEEGDLLALGSNVARGFGHSQGSDRAAAIADSFHGLWKALVGNMDSDGDGRVSFEEFHHGMTVTFTDKARYDEFFQPAVDAVLSLCDADGDGQVSMEEWRMIQSAYGTSAADADSTFRLLDRDGSGHLGRDEIAKAAHEFYTGTDPDAPGNQLFGPMS